MCALAVAAGVLGVVAVVKRVVFWRRYAMAGYGYGGCGGHHMRRGPGRTFWLRALFARLDTTPGQEREIRSAIEELQQRTVELKGGLRGARDDVAKAIGGEVFDESAIGDAAARADGVTAQLKAVLTEALRKIHAVLDPKQRERLAELLAKGPGFGRRGWGGPYREVL
jgi:uncharacterized membrane protein